MVHSLAPVAASGQACTATYAYMSRKYSSDGGTVLTKYLCAAHGGKIDANPIDDTGASRRYCWKLG